MGAMRNGAFRAQVPLGRWAAHADWHRTHGTPMTPHARLTPSVRNSVNLQNVQGVDVKGDAHLFRQGACLPRGQSESDAVRGKTPPGRMRLAKGGIATKPSAP